MINKSILIALALFVLPANLNCQFESREAEQAFLEQCGQAPAAITQAMDLVFSDARVSDIFSEHDRREHEEALLGITKELLEDELIMFLPGNNFVITSKNPDSPLYNHVVIIPKFQWPSKYQALSRVTRSHAIASMGLDRIKPIMHWPYIVPNRPEIDGILGDPESNRIAVIAEKIRPIHNGIIEQKSAIQTFLDSDFDPELISQVRAVIDTAGIWNIYPEPGVKLALVLEDGWIKASFMDLEQSGLPQYSGDRDPAFPDIESEYLGNEARCGQTQLAKLLSE